MVHATWSAAHGTCSACLKSLLHSNSLLVCNRKRKLILESEEAHHRNNCTHTQALLPSYKKQHGGKGRETPKTKSLNCTFFSYLGFLLSRRDRHSDSASRTRSLASLLVVPPWRLSLSYTNVSFWLLSSMGSEAVKHDIHDLGIETCRQARTLCRVDLCGRAAGA
jgi:hypothetical protein